MDELRARGSLLLGIALVALAATPADAAKADTIAVPAAVAARPIQALTGPATKTYIDLAFTVHDELGWHNASYRRVARCRTLSRARRRCAAFWVLGDTSYNGHITIWLGRKRGEVFWFYSYRIRMTNEYCVATGGHNCHRTYVVR